jgi:16S rRNA (cytosine967-C5)-methyltransferase
LDACAAPGGKTAHMLEKFKPQSLIALDQDSKRLLRVTENLQRLQLIKVMLRSLLRMQPRGNNQALDCIVLDAPCSATGVIRRHPDIRLLRQSSDIAQTIELQKQILQNLWQQLKVGGTLLYITCSILKLKMNSKWLRFLLNMPMLKNKNQGNLGN